MVDLDASDLIDVVIEMVVVIEVVGVDVVFAVLQLVLLRMILILVLDTMDLMEIIIDSILSYHITLDIDCVCKNKIFLAYSLISDECRKRKKDSCRCWT